MNDKMPDSLTTEEKLTELVAQLRQRDYEIALLRETTQAIGSELDLDRVLDLIAKHAQDLLKTETVLVPILNAACAEYTYRAGAGKNAEETLGESLPIDFGICGWVWKHQKPWWRGALADLSPQERNRWEKDAGTLLMVPLVGRRHFLGGIAAMNKLNGEEFTENDLRLLELFAGQAAIAIENAMAMEQVEQARQASEDAQSELQRVNKRLNAVNHELEYLSLYDPLTSLPNRSLFLDRFNNELNLAAANRTKLALLIIDIDRFQEINDNLGHEAGDDLLMITATQLHILANDSDILGRMSGDEFALLLQADEAQARESAEKILDLLSQPVTLAGQEMVVTSAVGIALYPEHGDDISTLFKHADEAMVAAKRDKSGIRIFDQHLNVDGPGRLALLQDLRKALANHEFELHYQPKIDLAQGRIDGVEALARWQRGNSVAVPPDMFIGALEQTGLITSFTYWALHTAMAQRERWLQRGWDINIAVNVPLSVVMDNRFLSELSTLFDHHRNAHGLVLEITENIFLGDYDRINSILSEVRSFGFGCSIDDFGTGHSSLARLRQLPVDEIKVDRSFVMGMLANKDDEVIVRSTIELAHNLGLKVVAEGVENAKIMKELAALNCDIVQGYHISRALPAAELEKFLSKGRWTIPQSTIPTEAKA
jgi:diguanylate cyclase (GGDEF)-like protein